MQFFDLGPVPWQEATAFISALASMRREAVVLAHHDQPTLCVGELVNLEQTIQLDTCQSRGIPISKPEARSNALCFAQSQLELRVVLPDDRIPLDQLELGTLSCVLAPILEALRELGIEAVYKPPNELVAHGRRIARACKAKINGSVVISASLAVEFDADLFAEVLHAPDGNLKARLTELVRARRTSIRGELSTAPPIDTLERRVGGCVKRMEGVLAGTVDEALEAKIREFRAPISTPRKAHAAAAKPHDWNVDIGASTELQQRTCYAPGGLLRATSEWQNGRLASAMIGGDFLCYPPGCVQRLESALVGVPVGQVGDKICDFYRKSGWITPGVQPGHWAKVLLPVSLEDYVPVAPSR